MDDRFKPNTDQRAGVRPIAFLLDNLGSLSDPVYLNIRPEDLTRSEPSRISVHQTLGRDVQGWADNFGAGLPSVQISGHTGWRTSTASGLDGAQAFERLNQLIMRDYHVAKQNAIDSGADPADVKLIFCDTLDRFTWNVAPMQFVLKRNKNSPLLFRYQINLQAVDTNIARVAIDLPNITNPGSALFLLSDRVSELDQLAGLFPEMSGLVGIIKSAVSVVTGAAGAVSSLTNAASRLALQGVWAAQKAFRVLSSVTGAVTGAGSTLLQLGSTLNELACLFSNALKPAPVYEQYSGLLGASNCSSTTGGSPRSAFEGQNVFGLMFAASATPAITGAAASSIAALSSMDEVLDPMSPDEVQGHLSAISGGAA